MDKRYSILFILHLPPPYHGSSIIGEVIKNSQVIKQNYECKFINLSTSTRIEEIGEKNLKKIFRYFSIIFQVIWQFLFFRPKLCYIAITVTGGAFFKDSVLAIISKLFGVKILYHFHSKGVSEKENNKIYDLVYRCIFRKSSAILLTSRLFYDIKKYFSDDNIFYCPNGTQVNKSDYIIKRNNDIPIILFFSNMIRSKGVFELLKACELLNKKGIDFRCWFVGKWSDITERDFNNQVNDLMISEKVHYLGAKYGKDKENTFIQADIFALPTFYHYECFPLVILEAMSYDLPIISTFEGGIPDIVDDNVTGYIVPQHNTEILADKLEILINNPCLRQQMGIAGKKYFEENFTLQHFELNFSSILRTVNEGPLK